MAELGIVKGIGNGMFAPEKSVTRAEFAVMLLRTLNIPEQNEYSNEFSDVNSDDWHAKYLASALKSGLISGYEDNTFRPDMPVSREEMAQMLSRACAYKGIGIQKADISFFEDSKTISAWSYDAVSRMVGAEIMQGISNSEFSPRTNATRAQSAAVMKRLLDIFKRNEIDA